MRWLLLGSIFCLTTIAAAHPANIPIARAKVQPNGAVELNISFDILAFVLDETPTVVLDAPMNALLDGPAADLQSRLDTAKERFMEAFTLKGGDATGVIDSVAFPNGAEIHKVVDGGQLPRLPVMMTATIKCHLPSGSNRVSFQFAEVLGTVILSTNFPYFEPISESVEPGDWSQPQAIPTGAEVSALAAAARGRNSSATDKPPTEAEARVAIQAQYDAWSKAYMAHDLDTLFGILAPGYTLRNAKGALITASEYQVMLKLRKRKHSDTTHYGTELLRITLRDGVAAVWSRETTTDPGTNGTTGKTEPVSYMHDYVDLWVLSGGKWLLKSTETRQEVVIPTVR